MVCGTPGGLVQADQEDGASSELTDHIESGFLQTARRSVQPGEQRLAIRVACGGAFEHSSHVLVALGRASLRPRVRTDGRLVRFCPRGRVSRLVRVWIRHDAPLSHGTLIRCHAPEMKQSQAAAATPGTQQTVGALQRGEPAVASSPSISQFAGRRGHQDAYPRVCGEHL